MPYNVQILPRALKLFKKIASVEQPTIMEAINALAENPRPYGYKELKGEDAFRVRVGDYRIVYEIHDDILLVYVIRIRHRKEAYD